jgi:hypothetical protein
MTGEEHYSLHDDAEAEAEPLSFSTRLADPPFEKLLVVGLADGAPASRARHVGAGVAATRPARYGRCVGDKEEA